MLAGLQKSNVIIVAARPSMGKTSLAMNIAQHAALRADKVVAVFSLEMSKPELTNRILCSEAMVDMEKVRHGRLNEDDWRKLIETMGHLSASKLYIDDTAGISVAEIRSKCRRLMVESKQLDLIVIDYLTLMSTSGKSDSFQLEIADLSRSLKGLARELKVPIIVISQLSRAAAKRNNDHRPVLSDLRDSGAIEQDADVVLFVHRESYYRDKGEEDDGEAEIIIAKQRNGPVGKVNVKWLAEYTRFMPISDREAPPN
jgi:replicative DNA helicase